MTVIDILPYLGIMSGFIVDAMNVPDAWVFAIGPAQITMLDIACMGIIIYAIFDFIDDITYAED